MESLLHCSEDHILLIEKSKHVLYEIQQFEGKSQRLAHFAGSNDIEEYIIHSVFESFLVHSRVIYEFLFTARSQKTDIRADDFEEEIGYQIPIPDKYLKDWAKFMTDKRLMHLTTNRLKIPDDKHEWEINKIYVPMHKQLLAFYRWVPNEHICTDLQRLKESELLEADSSDAAKPGNEDSRAPWRFSMVVDTSGRKLVVTKT
jgi:hypothetical protein